MSWLTTQEYGSAAEHGQRNKDINTSCSPFRESIVQKCENLRSVKNKYAQTLNGVVNLPGLYNLQRILLSELKRHETSSENKTTGL
jgi:hypothetical protein